MADLLYLDTARLGRMSPGAAAAHRDFVALAGDEGGGLYFDRFLANGFRDCPDFFPTRYPGLAHWRGVTGVAFDPAGREVRTAAAEGSVQTWDAATGNQRSRRATLEPPDDATGGVVRSPDGRWAVSYRVNPAGPFPPWVATLWDAGSGERKYDWGVGGRVQGLIPVPGERLLIGRLEGRGGSGYQIQAWDTTTGESMPSVNWAFHPSRTQYAVSPDGKTVLTIDEESAVGFDLTTGKERFSWKLADHDVLGRAIPKTDPRPGLVRAVAFSPDGKSLAIAVGGEAFPDVSRRTDNLVLVEARTGKVVRHVRTPETQTGWLVFSSDGRWVAGRACVWEVATLKEVRRFPARPEVTAAGFSPDGRRVATGHANGTAVVWAVSAE